MSYVVPYIDEHQIITWNSLNSLKLINHKIVKYKHMVYSTDRTQTMGISRRRARLCIIESKSFNPAQK